MLYHFFSALVDQIGALNAFTYLTTRSIFAMLSSLAVGWLLGPKLIRYMQKESYGQQVRDDGPANHLIKQGTPTMGGALILASTILGVLLWGDLSNTHLWLLLFTLVSFAAVGFIDDRAKISKGNAKGLSVRRKIVLQSILACIILYVMYATELLPEPGLLYIPFLNDVYLPLGIIGFFGLGYFVIVGSSNAVNLTDGLDGLAVMPAIMVASGLGVFAYVSGHSIFADYLVMPSLPGVGELVIFCAALAGSGLAFLWYNAYPAEVFMGDIGSLSIGAALGLLALMVQQELVFAVMSGLFVVEAASVILQVTSYKLLGRRIFKMAPLHHHFELKGWKENQVVVRFWIITLILVLIGLSSLKLR